MRGISTLFMSVVLTTAVLLSLVNKATAQASDQRRLDQIVSRIQSVLPTGWKVNEGKLNVVPRKWGENYSAYQVNLSNPTIDLSKLIKGPGGSDRSVKYTPFYVLYFVPIKTGLTLQGAEKEQRDIVDGLGAAQESFPHLYGASNEYILIFEESEKTGWRDGLAKISEKFKMKPSR